MTKSLSETHPTLYKKMVDSKCTYDNPMSFDEKVWQDDIQECTVDLKEHELALQKQRDALKLEHESILKEEINRAVATALSWQKRRVKKAFEFSDEWWEELWQNDRDLNEVVEHVKKTVLKELDLLDEEQKEVRE